MDIEDLESFINKFVEDVDEEVEPLFYVVSGSHIYGFNDEDSDIDVKGVHKAKGKKWMSLYQPKEQYIVNQQGVREGFEEWEDVDFTSYELRKFTYLLTKENFNMLEIVFCGNEVLNNINDYITVLEASLLKYLPGGVPRTYLGMAKSNYHKYLKPNKESYNPNAKKFLYVLRGILGSMYVSKYEGIEANIIRMSERLRIYQQLVKDLVEEKRTRNKLSYKTASRAKTAVNSLFNQVSMNDCESEREELRKELDTWMMTLRKNS